ncbi:MAG: HXXEE domain-containing protein [Ignavibacteria bacterium]|nr:HXXEE domain-containing protein [Ignavibacteria bacterium]
MDNSYFLWILTFAYAAHAFEERIHNWNIWAKKTFNVDVSWEMFYCANFAVVVLGISCASVGWKFPGFALSLPALALINALFFHILPAVVTRTYSPGTITSVFLFIPLGTLCYISAARDNVLGVSTVLISVASGLIIMAFPFALLKLKERLRL